MTKTEAFSVTREALTALQQELQRHGIVVAGDSGTADATHGYKITWSYGTPSIPAILGVSPPSLLVLTLDGPWLLFSHAWGTIVDGIEAAQKEHP